MNFPTIPRYAQYSFTGLSALVVTAILINFLVIQGWSSASPGHDGGHGEESTIQGTDSAYPLVTVAQPTNAETHTQTIEAAGQVLSEKQGQVFARRDGVIRQLNVNLGDKVYKGQILASLQSDRDDAAIAAEITLKKKQLDIVAQRAVITTDTHLQMAEQNIVSTEKQKEAKLQQISAQISGLEKEMKQKASQVESAAFDLLDSINELLFTRADGISNYYKHSNFDSYRRVQLYYGQGRQPEVEAFEKDVIIFFKSIKNGISEDQVDEVATKITELGTTARSLSQSISDSPDFSYEQIDSIRKEVSETLDHIIEITSGYIEKESQILSLEAEKNSIVAESDKDVNESKTAKVDVEAERKNADLDVAEIQAEIESLQQQLGASSTIYAPFSGVITKRHVNIGDSVNDDKPLFSIVDDSNKFVRFQVTENDIPFIREGTTIQFSPTAAPSQKYSATVKRIAKAIDPVNRTILIEADIDNSADDGRILTEMTVRASVPISIEEGLIAIPETALEVSGSQSHVFIVSAEAEVQSTPVSVAYVYAGTAYISEGITDNDWIVTKSPTELTAGMPVDTTL